MEYIYKKDTLLHSVGFNLQRFESVLNHGIVSRHKATEMGLVYSKNYTIEKQDDDYISLVRVGDINPEEDISAYKLHTIFGISFIIEDIVYRNDREDFFIHRQDEVLVKDYIPTDNIRGIAIPLEYQNVYLFDILIIPPDITNYKFIYDIAINYCNFLKLNGSNIDTEHLLMYLQEIYLIHKALYDIKGKDEYKLDEEELIADHQETLKDLNEFLAEETFICFSEKIGKNATLNDAINYLTKGKFEIYGIPYGYGYEGMKRA